jgi:hypothetical protein
MRGGHKKKIFEGVLINSIPLYTIWCGIKSRCYNKNAANYKYYGAKGIIMCEEWLNDFKAFYNWALNKGWRKGLSVDRYPNNAGNYEPDNCRLATMKEQASNKTKGNTVNNFKGINEKRRLERLKNKEL